MKAIDLSALDEVEARLGETHSRIAAQMAEVSRLQADGADDTQALYVLQDLQETIHQQIECAEKLLRDYEGELNQTVGPPLFKPRQPAEGAEQRFIVGNVRGGNDLSDWDLLRVLKQSINELQFAREQTTRTIRESAELLELARQIECPLLNADHQ